MHKASIKGKEFIVSTSDYIRYTVERLKTKYKEVGEKFST